MSEYCMYVHDKYMISFSHIMDTPCTYIHKISNLILKVFILMGKNQFSIKKLILNSKLVSQIKPHPPDLNAHEWYASERKGLSKTACRFTYISWEEIQNV